MLLVRVLPGTTIPAFRGSQFIVHSTTRGWKLTGFAGWAAARNSEHKDHARLGLNVQRYQHLFGGDRVLIGRAQIGWVSANRGEVPFVDLPGLGGSTILRGYRRGRFRDRTSALATAEYRFPIHRQLSGFLFLDSGTVARKLSQLDANEIHLGGGAGLHIHGAERLLVRMQVGLGEDGVVLNASFSSSGRVRRSTKRR